MNSKIDVNKDHAEHINSHVCTSRCVSWTAVIVGALIAISFSFLLNLLCLGIGLSAFPKTESGQLVFAIAGFIGLVFCSILAMFPAGYVAGKLSRAFCLKRRTGELHGIAAWSIALIASIILGASVGKFINQASYVVTRQPVEVRLTNLYYDQTYRTTHNEAGATKVEIDPDKAADAASMATFATFFIFFIGMLAAAFGGRCAMMCGRSDLENSEHCLKCNCK